MNIFTFDIIGGLLLFILTNKTLYPLLQKNFGSNFWFNEIVILILIVILLGLMDWIYFKFIKNATNKK